MTTEELEYRILADTRQLDNLTQSTHRLRDSFGRLAKGAGLAAGVGGLGALAVAAKAGFSEFAQGEKVAAQTAAVLKSTGGAAGVTAKHVAELGAALLKKSGVDDEAIKSGENMLLTFTNIRNEAGRGNKIFDQATRAALDMSVAMGTDAKSAALTLGKALNDPAAGLTKLTKQGVTFTESQKETIKSLVASGHTMAAQKIVLAELGKEFGGSAAAAGKTFSGQISIAKETLMNFAGDAVGAAMPAIAALVKKFSEALPAMIAFGERLIDKVKPAIAAVATFIGSNVIPIVVALKDALVAGVQRIVGVFEANRENLTKIWHNLSGLLSSVATVIRTVLVPALEFIFTQVLPRVIAVTLPVLATLSNAFRVQAAVIRAVVDAVTFVANNVGPALARIAAAFTGAKTSTENLIGDIVGFWRDLPGRVAGAITGKAHQIKDAIVGVFSGLPTFVKKILGISSPSRVFMEIGENIIHGAIAGIRGKAGALRDAALAAFNSAQHVAVSSYDALKGLTSSGLSALKNVVVGGGGSIGSGAFGLQPQVLRALAFARQHGWFPGGGGIISGFRTLAEQTGLWNRYVSSGFDPRYIAARPGTSSHESGNAVDVYNPSLFDRLMEMAPASARLMNNVPGDYGHFSVSGHALGGITTGASLGVIGEKGREAILPLDSSSGRKALAAALKDALGGRGGGPVLHVENQYVRDPVDVELVASAVGRRLALR